MNIEIKTKTENKLLNRTEASFEINHSEASTPNRLDVKKHIAAKLGADEKAVAIKVMKSQYGASKSTGLAHVYKSEKELQRIEPKYIIERNTLKKKEEVKAEVAANG